MMPSAVFAMNPAEQDQPTSETTAEVRVEVTRKKDAKAQWEEVIYKLKEYKQMCEASALVSSDPYFPNHQE